MNQCVMREHDSVVIIVKTLVTTLMHCCKFGDQVSVDIWLEYFCSSLFDIVGSHF